MSGLEFLPKAKAGRSDVPVIMITAHGDADTKRRALAPIAFLTKPIDFCDCRDEIDMRIGHAGRPRVLWLSTTSNTSTSLIR